MKDAITQPTIQEPLCSFCDPMDVGIFVFLCGPLGVALAHYGIRKEIGENGCVGFSLTCCLCCIGAALNRRALFNHVSVPSHFFTDCFGYICCYCCFVMQEYRKMKKVTGKPKSSPDSSQHAPKPNTS